MIVNDCLTVALSSFVLCFCVVYFTKRYKEWKRLPNGPWGLPFIGYPLFLNLKPHLKITQFSMQYGPVFSMRMFSKNVVFLNNWQSVKEAFSNDAILGRPEGIFGDTLLKNEKNMTSLSGPPWREQRRFAVRVFRELGYGTQRMENNIKDELSYFLKEIENKADTAVKIHDLLISSVSNNICYFIFGHRFEYNDPMRQRMDFLLDRVPQVLQVTNMVALLPILMKFVKLFGSSHINETIKKLHEFEDLIDKEIEKHETKLEDDVVNDYLDAYLLEIKARTPKNEIGSFTRGILISNAMEFFAAGSETVRTSLEWILMFVAANSNIQNEIRKEIENAIGSNRLPSWSDRELMPFTQAVILETMRWVSIFPLNIPRRAMEDTSILGHFIPKNTAVIANFWAINRDSKLWTSPEIFDPCRFLSSDRKLKKIDALIPFSFGKRACVGETMAKFELFLYLTTILQSYKIKYADGMTPSFDAWLGLSMQPIQEPLLCFNKVDKS